jgi:phosphoribosylanthranilate isomerase
MRTRIKVCCMASIAEAQMAIAVGADAVGLVGKMPSGPGPIADNLITKIARTVPPPIASFLLTSETTAEAIAAHVERTRPTTVQMVCHVEPKEIERLSRLQPHVRRVQVIHVEDETALDLIAPYTPHVDAFLLDSGRPSAAIPEFGGTGRAHDWAVSATFVRNSARPVFLAGGLTAANVGEAIRRIRPFGVDLCSGVRTDGRLDDDKLTAFVAAVQDADFELGARPPGW